MKKTFKTFALMLLTAFAFSSCVDVPAPYNLPDKSSNSGADGGSTANEGTPITCAEAVQLTQALADGATSTQTYTITGYITQVVGDVSKNQQTFWMADTKDGGKVFEAYWANLPEGVTAFTAGTKVKITGKLMKYVNSNNGNVICEMKNATVTILEDDGGGGGTSAEGTPVTCAEAVQLTQALADGATSTQTYTITGYITEVVGNVSKNQQTFWMADTKDGGRVFEAYWANLPEGVTEFKVGTKVKITGKLLKYVNTSTGVVTPEIKNADVVILADDGGGGGTSSEGTPVTCAEAVQLTNALADNATSTETYTVSGYITEVVGNVSKNQQTFWMADTKDGGRVFEAYWANLPEGVTAFKVGTKVKITGKLLKYVNTSTGVVIPEIKNADVVILADDGGGGGGQTGDVQHISIAEFLAKADVNTVYELTGIVKNITNTTYGNFDLVEGDASIYIYGLLDLEGKNKNFSSLGIAEGDEVTLTGKYKLFNNKPEIENAQFVSVKKGDGGGGQGGDGGGGQGGGGDLVTDLVNGDFESWVSDSQPTGWKSASSASNAVLSKSTDARNGDFACTIKAPGEANKRLATQEMTLEAGSYTFSFYAKSTTANKSQTRAGFVPMKDDGTVGTYKYGDFFDLNDSGWTLVSYDFELTSTTTLCLLVMNPKNSDYSKSQDILVDDATLVKK